MDRGIPIIVYAARMCVVLGVAALLASASGCNTDKPSQPSTAPLAAFSGSPTTGQQPLTVAFTDQSTGTVSGWDWSFGDGDVSIEENPSHTYTTEGDFSVSLVVSGPAGTDTMTRVDYITASVAPLPVNDTVTITSDTVSAGDTAEVLINLINPDSAVASFTIFLRSADPGIVYDTASVLTPRFPSVGMIWQTARHDTLDLMSVIAFITLTGTQVPIAPGSGPIMSIRYAVDASVAPGVYAIDTSSILLLPNTDPVQISYESGLFLPRLHFVPGQIVVQ